MSWRQAIQRHFRVGGCYRREERVFKIGCSESLQFHDELQQRGDVNQWGWRLLGGASWLFKQMDGKVRIEVQEGPELYPENNEWMKEKLKDFRYLIWSSRKWLF